MSVGDWSKSVSTLGASGDFRASLVLHTSLAADDASIAAERTCGRSFGARM